MVTAVGKISKKEETRLRRRQEILEAAIHLWYKKGIAGTTMEEVAAAVGMTQGGLYHFVKSKNELIRMFAEYTVEFDKSKLAYRESLKNMSPTEILRKCTEHWIAFDETNAERAVILDREMVYFDHETRQLIYKSVLNVFKFFENLLVDGIKAGEFQVDNTFITAANIVSYASQYAMRRWALGKLFTPQEYAAIQTKAILKQILIDRKKT